MGLGSLMVAATSCWCQLPAGKAGEIDDVGSRTAFVLIWNVVWVNTVLFRITKEEVNLESPSRL